MTSDLTPLEEGVEPGALVECDLPLFDWWGEVLCKLTSSHLAREKKRRDRERNGRKVGLHNYLQPKGAYIVAY